MLHHRAALLLYLCCKLQQFVFSFNQTNLSNSKKKMFISAAHWIFFNAQMNKNKIKVPILLLYICNIAHLYSLILRPKTHKLGRSPVKINCKWDMMCIFNDSSCHARCCLPPGATWGLVRTRALLPCCWLISTQAAQNWSWSHGISQPINYIYF